MSFKKIALIAAFTTVSSLSFTASAAPSAEVTLQGIITSSTCDVTVNGGKSVLNVGAFKSADFQANQQLGSTPLPVSLTNCADNETGDLIVEGLTSVGDVNNKIFVNDTDDTVGFMIADEAGDIITKGQAIPAEAKLGEATDFKFTVGMASTSAAPTPGVYSAPILVAYVVE